jgi:23S rRNA pseudouridine2604 synthase
MVWTRTYSGVGAVRVNKWLAQEGVCSRREAEAAIAAGRVSIGGARVDDPGRKIEPGQTLTLADAGGREALTVVLNKPVGYVSAQPERGQIPAARLVAAANFHHSESRGAAPLVSPQLSLAPLGRLDQDSRGLLLLSEDGVLAKAVIGERSALDKEYIVRVDGRVDDGKLSKLRRGLALDGRPLKPARIDLIGPQILRFILREGRKRQIRRMCEMVQLHVVDLQRIRIGPLELGDLPEGKWRALTPAERALMLAKA